MTARSTRMIALAIAILSIAATAVAIVSSRSRSPDPGMTSSNRPSSRSPNIILVVTDDQRADELELMPWLHAQPWTRFHRAYVATPICCPSRASILTGRYPRRHGVLTNSDGEQLDERRTLATWLREAGYRTGLFGKYLNIYPFDRGPYVPPGWDRWAGEADRPPYPHYYDYTLVEDGTEVTYGDAPEDYETDVLAARALSFVREDDDRPFFAMFTPLAPHTPTTPSPRHLGAFAEHDFEIDTSPASPSAPRWLRAQDPVDGAALLDHRRRSAETLLAVDEAVAALVAAAPANTVVIYTSDNGYAYGDHGRVGKQCAYDECVRVPLLVRSPDQAPREIEELVSLVDLAPTILELAGARAREGDGHSLVQLLGGDASSWRDSVFIEMYNERESPPPFVALRTRTRNYVELGTGERELYDLDGDPTESRNLVDDPSWTAEAQRLQESLQQRIEEVEHGR